MSHSKKHMLDHIVKRIEQMKDALIFIKVKEDHLWIPENPLTLKASFIRPAFYWIEEIYQVEFTGYSRVRVLCSEEVWTRYFLWTPDFDEHREMKMLKKAGFELRKAIVARTRPDFFKKGKMSEAIKEAEKGSSQSTRTKAAGPK